MTSKCGAMGWIGSLFFFGTVFGIMALEVALAVVRVEVLPFLNFFFFVLSCSFFFGVLKFWYRLETLTLLLASHRRITMLRGSLVPTGS